MSNSMGLFLIGFGIALIVVFVILVQYVARHHPNSKIGRIAQAIDRFIDRLPEN